MAASLGEGSGGLPVLRGLPGSPGPGLGEGSPQRPGAIRELCVPEASPGGSGSPPPRAVCCPQGTSAVSSLACVGAAAVPPGLAGCVLGSVTLSRRLVECRRLHALRHVMWFFIVGGLVVPRPLPADWLGIRGPALCASWLAGPLLRAGTLWAGLPLACPPSLSQLGGPSVWLEALWCLDVCRWSGGQAGVPLGCLWALVYSSLSGLVTCFQGTWKDGAPSNKRRGPRCPIPGEGGWPEPPGSREHRR